ncbi:MAG: NADH-quinone oxidoreductase subunit J [Candidatus Omnitrophica bacterium]|nr:NADH-quinone oxidoreductase subunit J [Candidatus Omnitrophota bacterium]
MTHPGSLFVFGALALMVLLSAVWVVTLRNLFRAALSLGLVLVGVAGLFILLEAEFLAFVQILVYVGAILTLVVFAIMLTATRHAGPVSSVSRQRIPAALASSSLFAVLVSVTGALSWPATSLTEAVSIAALGQQLVTTLVLPFEVVSLVFVAAMVGAIVIATGRAPHRIDPGGAER